VPTSLTCSCKRKIGGNGDPSAPLAVQAHASLATIVTCIEFARKPEFRAPVIDKRLEYWKNLCNNLDHIEKMFKEGKNKEEVLTRFKH
jgi:hypothetical protein